LCNLQRSEALTYILLCGYVLLFFQWLRKTNRKPLLEAVEKMKEGIRPEFCLQPRNMQKSLFDVLLASDLKT
jgi:hypothetical protein